MYEYRRRIEREAAKYQKDENAYDPTRDGLEGAMGSTTSSDDPSPIVEESTTQFDEQMKNTDIAKIVKKEMAKYTTAKLQVKTSAGKNAWIMARSPHPVKWSNEIRLKMLGVCYPTADRSKIDLHNINYGNVRDYIISAPPVDWIKVFGISEQVEVTERFDLLKFQRDLTVADEVLFKVLAGSSKAWKTSYTAADIPEKTKEVAAEFLKTKSYGRSLMTDPVKAQVWAHALVSHMVTEEVEEDTETVEEEFVVASAPKTGVIDKNKETKDRLLKYRVPMTFVSGFSQLRKKKASMAGSRIMWSKDDQDLDVIPANEVDTYMTKYGWVIIEGVEEIDGEAFAFVTFSE